MTMVRLIGASLACVALLAPINAVFAVFPELVVSATDGDVGSGIRHPYPKSQP